MLCSKFRRSLCERLCSRNYYGRLAPLSYTYIIPLPDRFVNLASRVELPVGPVACPYVVFSVVLKEDKSRLKEKQIYRAKGLS